MIELSLSQMISRETVDRLLLLGFLSLILIGVGRGLIFSGFLVPKLKYPEMIAGLILVIDTGILLYQEHPSQAERMIGSSLVILFSIISMIVLTNKVLKKLSSLNTKSEERSKGRSVVVEEHSDAEELEAEEESKADEEVGEPS